MALIVWLAVSVSPAGAQELTSFQDGLNELTRKIVNHIANDNQLKDVQRQVVIGEFKSRVVRHRFIVACIATLSMSSGI